ncbi:MAG: hypothetical protein LBD03_02375 [Methanobrevibacter sp.]|jgi:hypothetical protein|nr:hypothetical protein [Candidatus Methanovirga procula]
MNFKIIGLFILLFSIIGMINAATLNIQYLGDPCKTMMIDGMTQNNDIDRLGHIMHSRATFTYPSPTEYNYTHTGKYKDLRLCVGYGRLEDGIYIYIKNLDNIYTYPSDQQLNVSFSDLRDGIETALDYNGDLSWFTGHGYGILGLDNKLHQPNYYIPPSP